MATINILLADTVSEKQSKIDTAAPGDVVNFEAGDHVFAGGEFLFFRGDPEDVTDITYTGFGVLRKTTAAGDQTEPLVKLRGGVSGAGGTKAHRVRIENLTFVRGGVFGRESGGAYKNVTIINCNFREIRSGIGANGLGRCIDFTSGLIDSLISNNTFEDCLILKNNSFGQAYAIYGHVWDGVVVTLNNASSVQQFLFIQQQGVEDGGDDTAGRVTVENNIIDGLTRTGIEIRTTSSSSVPFGNGTSVSGNLIQRWIGQANDVEGWTNSYGIHLPAKNLTDYEIGGNTIVGSVTGAYDGYGTRAGIRAGGIDGSIEGNAIQTAGFGIILSDGSGLRFWSNEVCGYVHAPVIVQGLHTTFIDGQDWSDNPFPNIYRAVCGLSDSPFDVPIPSGEYDWFSDLAPNFLDMVNGQGPIELDQSNGDEDPSDGSTIQIANAKYSKGIGTAAYSRIKFILPSGKYTRFLASVGVDDDVLPAGLNAGAVQFRVVVDGTQLFQSSVMRQGDVAEEVDVPINGRNEMVLEVVSDSGSSDVNHGSWGFARLLKAVAQPDPPKAVADWKHDTESRTFSIKFNDGSAVTYEVL